MRKIPGVQNERLSVKVSSSRRFASKVEISISFAGRGDLADTRGELADTRGELADTRGDLADTRGELADTTREGK